MDFQSLAQQQAARLSATRATLLRDESLATIDEESMVREPNLKNAVDIIRAEFAAAGIKLPYQKTLDIVAKSKGYAGYGHYLKAQAEAAQPAPATEAGAEVPRPFRTEIVFGSERVSALEHGTLEERTAALDEADVFSFATEAELIAFLDGVEAAEGWLDYSVVTEEDRARALKPDPDSDDADEAEEMNVHYRTARIRVYLPVSEFALDSVTQDAEGRLPVERDEFDLQATYQADKAVLEEIPYRSPLRFVLTNHVRAVHVLEFEAQLMFEARGDDSVREAMESLDYTVTLGLEKRVLESEIVSW
ncbi:hypothetical protein [Burkholderia cenocepacia]|uniref:hypothetical protein n=1 Tax=Burkholderia cenocepacia TaxID=95486 RepID=UPI00076C5514|nr:hypothetical protein [Burkholderia cenocepacia]KWU26319.1 hypothetical protein AS149_25345 [Burkholderia cenocepacia]